MKKRRAVVTGIVSGLLVLILVWIGGLLGHTDADLSALTAAVVFRRADGPAWFGGFAAQLLVGAIAGVVYAVCFEWATRRAGVLIGLVIAIPHTIIAGVTIGFLPGPRIIAAGLMPPGAFYEYRGAWCVAALIVAHLVFGALVGVAYGPTIRTSSRSHRRWSDIPSTRPLTGT